jgi:hypothetical protein
MNLLISDRDGVLFDTCGANIKSYLGAAEKLKLQTNVTLLKDAVHEGRAFLDFYFQVWGALSEDQMQLLRDKKSVVFKDEIGLVRVNHEYISSVIENEVSPFLVTRASFASTLYLLDFFQLKHFAERVISVNASESKAQVFRRISIDLGVDPRSIQIVDDSRDVVVESKMLGFETMHYPHFCNY